MLTLGRRPGEVIVIQTPQGEVRIVVIEIRDGGQTVKLGIQAEKSIPIVRAEIMGER